MQENKGNFPTSHNNFDCKRKQTQAMGVVQEGHHK